MIFCKIVVLLVLDGLMMVVILFGLVVKLIVLSECLLELYVLFSWIILSIGKFFYCELMVCGLVIY